MNVQSRQYSELGEFISKRLKHFIGFQGLLCQQIKSDHFSSIALKLFTYIGYKNHGQEEGHTSLKLKEWRFRSDDSNLIKLLKNKIEYICITG